MLNYMYIVKVVKIKIVRTNLLKTSTQNYLQV